MPITTLAVTAHSRQTENSVTLRYPRPYIAIIRLGSFNSAFRNTRNSRSRSERITSASFGRAPPPIHARQVAENPFYILSSSCVVGNRAHT